MSSPEEDEDLRIAIAMSLEGETSNVQQLGGLAPYGSRSAPGTIKQQPDETAPSKLPFLFSQLDRGKMEQDRLARVVKRPLHPSSPPVNKRMKSNVLNPMPPSTQKMKESTSYLEFPSGAVKRTWCFGYDRCNDIKIEEVLQKKDLRIAVFSAFDWDLEWLFRKIDIAYTKLVLIMQAKGPGTQEQYRREASDWNIPTLKLCFPNMTGQISCMHSKLMLLFCRNHLRVVVPTANLTKHDWGEDGIIENSVFMIDLPRLDGKTESFGNLTMFGKSLLDLLKAMDVPQMVIDGLLKFDFAETSRLTFLHTIGGSHYDAAALQTGLPGLGSAINRLGLASKEIQIDFAASSIGSLDDKFLTNLYTAASYGAVSKPGNICDPDLRKKIRLYFPLDETVARSKGGKNAAGTNCFQRHYFNSLKFPKECMRDYSSKRSGLLSHNKLLFVRGQQHGKNVAWAYVGSANISESAWGQWVTDRSKKIPKLNCRNWECGVLIPIPPERMSQFPFESGQLPPLEAVFEGIVDIPFEFPGQEYGSKLPWYFLESMSGVERTAS